MITLWFSLIVLCWVLFGVLEGFDFGVGILAPILGRDEHERAAAVRTVGPFWDGNEVWLVAAVGVTYAAFPDWYAALLAGTYLPMVLLLLLFAGRGVALEFRGKGDGPRWRRRCDAAMAGCSLGIVLVFGALLSVFVHGLALGADGSVTGGGLGRSLAPVLTPAAGAGALLALYAALLLGATFLALRTTGPVRLRARGLAVALSWAGAAAALVAAALGVAVALVLVVLLGAVGAAARLGREGSAFAGAALGAALATVAILTANGDVLLPSTLDPAWSLTRDGAAATGGALTLITAVGVAVLPGVLAYQAFSYWVFRRRVASEREAT